ncbi:hypothetical protein [Sphingomonas sp.]|uniref:hypothetical protein n=1 Tax=Sphingomonas sp. TaxID=28214 RepID=UPI003B006744
MSGTEMPVSGGGTSKGAPDGVSGSPDGGNVGGRTPGGESDGGGYDNPHAGKEPTNSGFMGHGGQTEIGYHGGGQAGEQGGDAPNSVTGSDSSDGEEEGTDPWAAPTYEPHAVSAGGRTFEVVETNGVAQAEQLGKVGTDATYEREQESPGSG